MAEHNILGKTGEDVAADYLIAKGFNILRRNWRSGHKEVDIIAMDGPTLVFVEVKTRTRAMDPSDLISYYKIRFLETAAESYIRRTNFQGDARFDLIILTKSRNGFDINYIPEAFR